jgi:hypothetical protein
MTRRSLAKLIVAPLVAAFLLLTFTPGHHQQAAADEGNLSTLTCRSSILYYDPGFKITVPAVQVGNYQYTYAYQTRGAATWYYTNWFWGDNQSGFRPLHEFSAGRWNRLFTFGIDMGAVVRGPAMGIVDVFERRDYFDGVIRPWFYVGGCDSNPRRNPFDLTYTGTG